MLIGLIVALGLTTLTMFRVSPKGLTYRQQETWISYSQVFVTQTGFPWGRLGVTDAGVTKPQPGDLSSQVADPGRLTSLAVIYSHLVTTDGVRSLMAPDHPPVGSLEAAPVLDAASGNEPLPIISIAAHSDSAKDAKRLAGAATKALVAYVERQQTRNAIPDKDRVDLVNVVRPDHAALEKGRSKAMPMIVFIVVMMATFALALVCENLRPRRAMPASSPSARTAA
jgi:hypothetical protein